ncbi:probable amino acid permease 7 [Olea europaea var. sylvestris]|uniref:probable amino acid permease 7 n=1 Tax=Olea europaea var. sylvestris TaxID=158386 RepID=UPI000C1D8561|nr:probable amino acid permease 7 [Olea europaea var. sylvestris]
MPPEKVTMTRASIVAVCITTSFYLFYGGFGYAAFGNSTPGNLLTGFGFYEPYWLVSFTNAYVALHVVGGYQVFSQPLFAYVEKWASKKFPNSKFVHKNYDLKQVPVLKLNLLRLCFRTSYVAFTTGFAILFPYFNQVVGVAGAINFWLIVVYFPVEMYLVQKNIGRWTSKFIVLRIYVFVTLLVIMFALVGSVKGLIKASITYLTVIWLVIDLAEVEATESVSICISGEYFQYLRVQVEYDRQPNLVKDRLAIRPHRNAAPSIKTTSPSNVSVSLEKQR